MVAFGLNIVATQSLEKCHHSMRVLHNCKPMFNFYMFIAISCISCLCPIIITSLHPMKGDRTNFHPTCFQNLPLVMVPLQVLSLFRLMITPIVFGTVVEGCNKACGSKVDTHILVFINSPYSET